MNAIPTCPHCGSPSVVVRVHFDEDGLNREVIDCCECRFGEFFEDEDPAPKE